jgi:hypothetical protein
VNYLLNMIVRFDKPRCKLMDYTDTYNHKRGGMIRKNVHSALRFLKEDKTKLEEES